MIAESDLRDPLYWIRWSLNSGLITDQIKDSLFGIAYLAHTNVKSAELDIDVTSKKVSYTLYISSNLHKAIVKYKTYIQSGGIIALWRARRLLKKHGNLELESIIVDFVSRYCGFGWSSSVTIQPWISGDKKR